MFRNIRFIMGLWVAILLIPSFVKAHDRYLGEILYIAGSFCPKGTWLADGSLRSIMQNQALYALLGPKYGGDGRTNFALPNLVTSRLISVGPGQDLSLNKPSSKMRSNQETVMEADKWLHSHKAIFVPHHVNKLLPCLVHEGTFPSRP